MKVDYIKLVRPRIDSIDYRDGSLAGTFFTPALIELGGKEFPEDVAGIKIGGKWFSPAPEGQAGDFDRRFESGEFEL